MAINNLSSLRLAMQDWVARTDIESATLDLFIDLAENEILNGVFDSGGRVIIGPLQCYRMEVNNPNFALVGEYTPLPVRFSGFKKVSLNGNPKVDLELTSAKVFDATYLSSNTLDGPKAYCIEGGHLRVGPGASATSTLDITYYQTPPVLSDAGENWICTNYPLAYLYGGLRHLAIYTGAERSLPYFQSAFLSALGAIHSKEKAIQFSGTAFVTRTLGVTTS
jgi:hypothetical protein